MILQNQKKCLFEGGESSYVFANQPLEPGREHESAARFSILYRVIFVFGVFHYLWCGDIEKMSKFVSIFPRHQQLS